MQSLLLRIYTAVSRYSYEYIQQAVVTAPNVYSMLSLQLQIYTVCGRYSSEYIQHAVVTAPNI